MFDFDEIEETVEKEGEWKEGVSVESPSKAGGCDAASAQNVSEERKEQGDGDGMFDFDEIEADATRQAVTETAKAGGTVPVEVRFVLQGEKWSRSFEVPAGSSVNDLRREMAGEEEWHGPA